MKYLAIIAAALLAGCVQITIGDLKDVTIGDINVTTDKELKVPLLR
tara:strand:- start:727 stop:864 length:138 start_codon:yes stop_codon:yes gene_type:complete